MHFTQMAHMTARGSSNGDDANGVVVA